MELSQVALAAVKMLSAEEERLCDTDDVLLFKTDLQSAKLGPALGNFKASVEELATYIASVPSAEVSAEPMNKYFLVRHHPGPRRAAPAGAQHRHRPLEGPLRQLVQRHPAGLP